MKRALLFGLFPFYALASVINYDVPVQDVKYQITTVDGYTRIIAPGGFSYQKPGYPELPAVGFNYLLPQGYRLKTVRVIDSIWEIIPGSFYIYPKQKEHLIGEKCQFTEPIKTIYEADTFIPGQIILSAVSGNLRGYPIAQILINPFRYQAHSGSLYILKKLRISITTEPDGGSVFPERQSKVIQNAFVKFLEGIVVNRSALNELKLSPVVEFTEDTPPDEFPSLSGPPVDLVIITDIGQFSAYERFAHYKKLSGYNTIVKTVSWIRQYYDGVDDAERLRRFIRDAVIKWGTGYILLGGDVDYVPTRWVWMGPIYNDWPMHITTDLYFSDLDGDWNFDGDERFGEVEDSLDLFPEVFVSRLPTHSSDQVIDYLHKVEIYMSDILHSYQTKALFFSSDLDFPNDAYNMALRLSDHLPQYFNCAFLNKSPSTSL